MTEWKSAEKVAQNIDSFNGQLTEHCIIITSNFEWPYLQ